MIIEKINIENYKIFQKQIITLNDHKNIFVGENDSGKSTILEIIEIITTGRLKSLNLIRQIKSSLFNSNLRSDYLNKISNNEKIDSMPNIIIEAYCKQNPDFSIYKGTQNSLGEDCPGIRITIEFDNQFRDRYIELVENNEIFDIPIEFYDIHFKYFSGEDVDYRKNPFKSLIIDTTKKIYSNEIFKFINNNITDNLTKEEQVCLSTAYRKNKNMFKEEETIKQLNNQIKDLSLLVNKKVAIELEERGLENWKNELTISIDEIPFDNIGYGSQNFAKIELAINNQKNKANIIMIEEPENNLSYTNMAMLISKIESCSKNLNQIFISTHSSFVANKLGLESIHILSNGIVKKMNELPEDTINYFKKLPGYNTLRIILSNRILLVEGPTEELLLNRAYFDIYNKLPIEDGLDIIVVDSLSFKRYCDIAIIIDKKIGILTDNDHDIKKNIAEKYKDYIDNKNITIFYEPNEKYNTIEPSVFYVNIGSIADQENFKYAISTIKTRTSMTGKNAEEILSFMLNNKTEWALRVFECEKKIKYPEYIINAIKK